MAVQSNLGLSYVLQRRRPALHSRGSPRSVTSHMGNRQCGTVREQGGGNPRVYRALPPSRSFERVALPISPVYRDHRTHCASSQVLGVLKHIMASYVATMPLSSTTAPTGSFFQHTSVSWPPVPSNSSIVMSPTSPPYPQPKSARLKIATPFFILHPVRESRSLQKSISTSFRTSTACRCQEPRRAFLPFLAPRPAASVTIRLSRACSYTLPSSASLQREQEFGHASLAQRVSGHPQGVISGLCLPSSARRVHYTQASWAGAGATTCADAEEQDISTMWKDRHESYDDYLRGSWFATSNQILEIRPT
ncbi:hypothetical protein D9619_009819 [Psilocybe cf. subviscida]|uniref:Uncharacterized protein n=1 Tax=Psilocybe cf. subviscida TaxID=2480587 RepID=A0A8H5BKP9_9AGAR|nr:hypothetical protein D9619_009819 [Psilocybe cf. subviscida]